MRSMPNSAASSIKMLKTTGCKCRCRWPFTWSSGRPVARKRANCAWISLRSCPRNLRRKKYFTPTPTGSLENSPRALTRPGISACGNAEWPIRSVRCRPTPRRGICFASSTASAQCGSLTIRLAVVRMPSRWARMTASLMDCERPKSSAFTISRRAATLPAGVAGRSSAPRVSDAAIAGRGGAGNEAAPGAENEEQFLAFAEPRRCGAENVELLVLEFPQQPPVDGAHEFGGDHRAAVFGRQRLTRQLIELFRARGHAFGQRAKAVAVLEIQNLLLADVETREFGLRQINPPALRIDADIAKDVGQLERFAEVNGVIAAGRVVITENLDAQKANDRRHAIAIKLELLVIFVTLDFQVHFAAANQFIEKRERQTKFPRHGLQLAVHDELRLAAFAGLADIVAPGGELFAAFFFRR